jgi:MFS family permease
MAQSAPQLIAARTLQGIGGALLSPQSLAILQVLFQGSSRATAISVYAGLITLGPILAQPLGGFLVTFFSWRSVFFVNLPLGVVAVALALWLVPNTRTTTGKISIDTVGVALLGAAMLCMSFALLEGDRFHWGTIISVLSIPTLLVTSVVLLGAFIAWNRGLSSPLIPPALFQDRTYGLMCALFGAATIGVLALFLPLNLYLQSVLGLSPLQAGLVMLPMPVTVLVLNTFIANRLAARVGARWTLLPGAAFLGLGSVIVKFSASPAPNYYALLAGLVVVAVGPGLLFAPLTTAAMRSIPPEMAGAASGVLSTSGQLGGVLGSAIVGAVFQSSSTTLDALQATLLIPILVAAIGGVTCLLLEPAASDTSSASTRWRRVLPTPRRSPS